MPKQFKYKHVCLGITLKKRNNLLQEVDFRKPTKIMNTFVKNIRDLCEAH